MVLFLGGNEEKGFLFFHYYYNLEIPWKHNDSFCTNYQILHSEGGTI